MKTCMTIVALGVLAGASAHAAEMPGHNMGGMNMSAPATAPAVHQTTGVVKAVDPALGTITLAHEPVPTLKWSAMTMSFNISPELARGVAVGQRVSIEFTAKGMNGTISKITVAK